LQPYYIAFGNQNKNPGRPLPAIGNAILAVYCPARQQCIYTTIGADRSTGAAAINVAPFSGEVVHTYIAFIAANGKDMSNSFYTGELTVDRV